jgi:hypothetical protein
MARDKVLTGTKRYVAVRVYTGLVGLGLVAWGLGPNDPWHGWTLGSAGSFLALQSFTWLGAWHAPRARETLPWVALSPAWAIAYAFSRSSATLGGLPLAGLPLGGGLDPVDGPRELPGGSVLRRS